MTPNKSNRLRSAIVAAASVATVATVLVSSFTDGRRVADATTDSDVTSIGALVPDDSLDPRIVSMELSGSAWRRSIDNLDVALFEQAENERSLRGAELRLEDLQLERGELDRALRAARRDQASLGEELTAVEAILQARALDRFVRFDNSSLAALDGPQAVTDDQRSEDLARRVDEVQFSHRTELIDQRDRQDAELATLGGRLLEIGVGISATEELVAETQGRRLELEEAVTSATGVVRRERRRASVPSADFSVVALDAYLNAERLLGESRPACQLTWSMIAGIARIESRHGEIGGRTIQVSGRPSLPIIGIALDGGPGVLAISDTDGGVLDGDTTWDRAVGPLQFIPQTWSLRGRDASGDGVADPHNFYDAAYSTGRYLCAVGGNLGNRSSLRSAYFAYNHSSSYVAAVISYADRYAAIELGTSPEPLPVADSVENSG